MSSAIKALAKLPQVLFWLCQFAWVTEDYWEESYEAERKRGWKTFSPCHFCPASILTVNHLLSATCSSKLFVMPCLHSSSLFVSKNISKLVKWRQVIPSCLSEPLPNVIWTFCVTLSRSFSLFFIQIPSKPTFGNTYQLLLEFSRSPSKKSINKTNSIPKVL